MGSFVATIIRARTNLHPRRTLPRSFTRRMHLSNRIRYVPACVRACVRTCAYPIPDARQYFALRTVGYMRRASTHARACVRLRR